MTFKEITTKLAAEGVTTQIFSEDYFDKYSTTDLRDKGYQKLPWLGKVELVSRQHEDITKQQDMQTLVYFLSTHQVYLSTSAFLEVAPNENDDEDGYYDFVEKHGEDSYYKYQPDFSPLKKVMIPSYVYWPDDATPNELAEMTLDLTDQCAPCNLCQRPPHLEKIPQNQLEKGDYPGYYRVQCPKCTQYVVGKNRCCTPTPRTEADHKQAMGWAVQDWNSATPTSN